MPFERLVLGACAAALFLVMATGAADVAAGNLFGVRVAFMVDLTMTLVAAAIFLAWPATEARGEHIRVDLFAARGPDWVKGLSEGLSRLAALAVYCLIAWGAWRLALASVAIREASTATIGFPIWPAKLACAAGASLAALVSAARVVRFAAGGR